MNHSFKLMNLPCRALVVTGMIAFTANGKAAEPLSKFQNGSLTDHVKWLDTSGNLINAHDGGIIYAEGKYHWYGMAARPMSVKEGGQKTTVGVVMYASTDLYNWDYEGVILECSTEPKHPLNGPMRFERPKIVYNERTKTYVLWCHYVKAPGDPLALWKGNLAGRDRVVLTKANAVFDSGKLRLQSETAASLMASVYPPLNAGDPVDGIFGRLPIESVSPQTFTVFAKQEKQAGPPREIPMGKSKIAAAPGDSDFASAAVWSVKLPADFDPAKTDALLRIDYKGDVARVKIGGKLVMDDFYNGLPLEIGLRRYADEIKKAGGLTIEILPFRADAPVFLPIRPTAGSPPMLSLDAVHIVPLYHVEAR